jgi:hypothetical protein
MCKETLFRMLHAEYVDGVMELDELNDLARELGVDYETIHRFYTDRVEDSRPRRRRSASGLSCRACAQAALVHAYLGRRVSVYELLDWADALRFGHGEIVATLEACADAAYGADDMACFHKFMDEEPGRTTVSSAVHSLAADS